MIIDVKRKRVFHAPYVISFENYETTGEFVICKSASGISNKRNNK